MLYSCNLNALETNVCCSCIILMAGKMAQWLQRTAVLAEDLGSILSSSMQWLHLPITPGLGDPMLLCGLCSHCLHIVHAGTHINKN